MTPYQKLLDKAVKDDETYEVYLKLMIVVHKNNIYLEDTINTIIDLCVKIKKMVEFPDHYIVFDKDAVPGRMAKHKISDTIYQFKQLCK